MFLLTLSDRAWEQILTVLRQQPDLYIGQPSDCRRFVEAVLWILRSASQWRQLPPEYGSWNSVYKRYARWHRKGIWHRLQEYAWRDPVLGLLIFTPQSLTGDETIPDQNIIMNPLSRDPTSRVQSRR